MDIALQLSSRPWLQHSATCEAQQRGSFHCGFEC